MGVFPSLGEVFPEPTQAVGNEFWGAVAGEGPFAVVDDAGEVLAGLEVGKVPEVYAKDSAGRAAALRRSVSAQGSAVWPPQHPIRKLQWPIDFGMGAAWAKPRHLSYSAFDENLSEKRRIRG